ncbi:50S ribosomal protein L6 [Reichenbachiella carrageenanivorans]|uniref:Large ribosomal subunit protein uL6 n=1 Tax=Reichenbachiella carrageenanivorans TaxID=2979869 RepID=A0ABY6D5Q7_9BACT|nr:50S ribosomal protein L6 [Reichenbachiella carrageenanivorans]UXX81169.1 50S ribosomal protein L6 [Reichenbachiella carrageenanivorans]
MSRIGKKPIAIPSGVEVTINGGSVTVKGAKGTLAREIDSDFKLAIEDGVLTVQRPTEQKRHKALHGLYRSLLNNMVEGVSDGFKKQLELVGVGYKAAMQGQILELNLGYSHNIFMEIPKEVSVSAETQKGKNPIVSLESADKELIGEVCAKIRSLRKVEPYKGKGIRFVGEIIRRKAGKTAAK